MRDFTINSLFYNVNEALVEDWSKMGKEDLQKRIIRTTKSASETLRDDPLRLLRSVRFACRFSFALHEDIFLAAKDKEIVHRLSTGVTRERIGTEIDGILSGPQPTLGIKLILELNLFHLVFRFPPDLAPPENFPQLAFERISQMEGFLHYKKNTFTSEEKTNLFLSAILLPIGEVEIKTTKLSRPVSSFIIMESLKKRTKEAKEIGLTHKLVHSFCTFSLQQNPNRRELGRVMRQAGSIWSLCLAIALTSELSPSDCPFDFSSKKYLKTTKVEEIIQKYEILEKNIHALNLIGIWNMKPLLDGTEVGQLLEIPPGPILKDIFEGQIDWQLDHPNLGADEQKKWLLSSQWAKTVSYTHLTLPTICSV
eukprot:TRINITY_DN3175_c0_g1_i2.p1 TRINITY_DN3175_c0_g1~~TRINITY_DN3175_c0_g1_i2.p1  ORF type:complete len:367 (-),score=97.97 TRINITY_DN3175_c0_g1_i2:11-1111(-)